MTKRVVLSDETLEIKRKIKVYKEWNDLLDKLPFYKDISFKERDS